MIPSTGPLLWKSLVVYRKACLNIFMRNCENCMQIWFSLNRIQTLYQYKDLKLNLYCCFLFIQIYTYSLLFNVYQRYLCNVLLYFVRCMNGNELNSLQFNVIHFNSSLDLIQYKNYESLSSSPEILVWQHLYLKLK